MAAEPMNATPRNRASLLAQLRRSGLNVRLGVLSAALAALVTVATFTVLNVQVGNSTRALFTSELTRNGRTLVSLQHESRRHLVLTASVLAESPTLTAAIETYRAEQQAGTAPREELTATVDRELRRLGDGLPGGMLLVTDEAGKVVASYVRGQQKSLRGLDLASLPAVRNALDASLVTTADDPYLAALELGDRFFGVGVAPLIVHDFTVGTIVVGEAVDSSFVTALRRSFEGDVVISAGSRIVGSTLPGADAEIAARSPDTLTKTVALSGDEYLSAVVPVGKTQLGNPLRITLLQPLGPAVRGLRQALLRDFVIYGLLAVILAGVSAAMLARSLLRPLVGFIRFMRRGADRERVDEAFDASNASQEIRVLNETFNQLMASLSGKRAELERRGTELAAANEVLTDEIRERERVEQALRDSEAQLRQSQKLEAVGTLAGGIAHDFNNMLTVISGFTQFAMSRLGKEHPVTADLKQVSDAANSAASLTHQLLAFSRKQVLQPRVLELDTVLNGVEGMLRRLIGAHITLEVLHEGDPARVKADPGQLEQVLLNLVVNARDAMPQGGTLSITTGTRISATGARQVMLRVRDNGSGMSREVRERIFEPFFTTKEVGKGTGLGLSTVYGIVVQSGGSIEVESEPGQGTTITVVLPPIAEALVDTGEQRDDDVLPHGTESILLVDDEEAVLNLAQRTLESCGYSVIIARSGVEALATARTARVDLIVTDVVMPQLSGPKLVERYLAKHPEPRIIYMTGYVDDETMRLELDEEVVLLRKPFGPVELARIVRTVLDSRPASMTPA